MKNNRKPFNLEDALRGFPVETRDKQPVSELHLFQTIKDLKQQLVAIIEGRAFTFDIGGRYISWDIKSDKDFFMSPKKIKGWVNVYRNLGMRLGIAMGVTVYETREEAANGSTLSGRAPDRVDCIEVEIEGQ